MENSRPRFGPLQRRTRVLGVVLASTALGVTAAACSEGGSAGAEAEKTLSFAHVLAENQVFHQCGVLDFEAAINDAEVGLTVELYPGATTHASTVEQLDAIDVGDLDITLASANQLATRFEPLTVFDAFYAFRDHEHMLENIEGEAVADLWETLREDHGYRVLGFGYYGSRHMTGSFPVETPADLAGVKMRVVDTPLSIDNGRAMGADPVPVAFGELYIALQQGVIDAQENPLPVIDGQGLTEVQDYVSLTAHNISNLNVVISESTFADLTEEQQEALIRAGEIFSESATTCTIEEEIKLLEEWSGDDSPITVFDGVDLDAFRAQVEDVLVPLYEDVWGTRYTDLRDS